MTKVYPAQFESFMGKLPANVHQRIDSYNLEHRLLTPVECDAAVLDMVKAITEDNLSAAGPARHPIWEKGWAENLNAFDPAKAGRELAKPHYYNKYPVMRWGGQLVEGVSPEYEYGMLCALQDCVFDRYLKDATTVIECGCGTGHNLFRVRDVNPTAKLIGMDWAESAVKFINLQAGAGAYGPGPAAAYRFNFFNPDLPNGLDANDVCCGKCAFLTIAAMEQIGSKWQAFYSFLQRWRPAIVVHIEPIGEVLDPTNLYDYLSLAYFKKRNYLNGWLNFLSEERMRGYVKIHDVIRTRIGSKFIEGYTVVAWSPA